MIIIKNGPLFRCQRLHFILFSIFQGLRRVSKWGGSSKRWSARPKAQTARAVLDPPKKKLKKILRLSFSRETQPTTTPPQGNFTYNSGLPGPRTVINLSGEPWEGGEALREGYIWPKCQKIWKMAEIDGSKFFGGLERTEKPSVVP